MNESDRLRDELLDENERLREALQLIKDRLGYSGAARTGSYQHNLWLIAKRALLDGKDD